MVSQLICVSVCLSFITIFQHSHPHTFFAVKVLRTVETNTDKDTINQNKNSLTQSHNKLEKETTYIQHEKHTIIKQLMCSKLISMTFCLLFIHVRSRNSLHKSNSLIKLIHYWLFQKINTHEPIKLMEQ